MRISNLLLGVLLGVSLLSSGCAVVAIAGANAMGVGSPDETKLKDLTANNFALAPSQVQVSNIRREGGISTAVHYDVILQLSSGPKPMHCMVSGTLWINSSPLCAKPGESLTGGSSPESCNALLKAAKRC